MEITTQYLLQCSTNQNERPTLLSKLRMKNIDTVDKEDYLITLMLLYDDF